jgi:DNA-binding NarL/FixJ family response regulator
MSRSIRLLLAEDHASMRAAIRGVLADHIDLHVVGEAVDGAEAMSLAEDLLPDVVVMDINMPRINGIDAARHIKSHFPHIAILGLSVNANEYRDAMLKIGAAAVIQKERMAEDLKDAIRAAVQEVKHLPEVSEVSDRSVPPDTTPVDR